MTGGGNTVRHGQIMTPAVPVGAPDPVVILTRPRERNQHLAAALRAAGIAVIEAPTLCIAPLDSDFPEPQRGDLCVFVSRNAVDAYFRRYACWRTGAWAAAVGQATAQALLEHVPSADLLHPPHGAPPDSEHLLPALLARLSLGGGVHIYRAQQGRDWLADQLRERGGRVTCHAVYQRVPVLWPAAPAIRLSQGRPLVLLLTSLEGLDGIARSLQCHGLTWPVGGLSVVTLHERMARRLQYWCKDVPADRLAITYSAPDDCSLFRAILTAVQSA